MPPRAQPFTTRPTERRRPRPRPSTPARLPIGSTETLQAIAVATGMTDTRGRIWAAYTISSQATVSTPTFYPPPGTYLRAIGEHLGCHLGRQPSTTLPTELRLPRPRLRTPAPLRSARRRRWEAIAVATGDTNSVEAFAAYTISLANDPGVNADLLTRRWHLYLCAIGDHLRCHVWRNHLLHDQRNDADHVLHRVRRPHYG